MVARTYVHVIIIYYVHKFINLLNCVNLCAFMLQTIIWCLYALPNHFDIMNYVYFYICSLPLTLFFYIYIVVFLVFFCWCYTEWLAILLKWCSYCSYWKWVIWMFVRKHIPFELLSFPCAVIWVICNIFVFAIQNDIE